MATVANIVATPPADTAASNKERLDIVADHALLMFIICDPPHALASSSRLFKIAHLDRLPKALHTKRLPCTVKQATWRESGQRRPA
jgi:hypothetical protein